jgi:4-diphosphocytidyl-2-C-methyl-D-erythritol kinase
MVRETAKAKINLDLRVLGRRANGYHDLDSLVAFTELGDELTFSPADELTLSISGPFAAALAGEPGNLALDAARRLAANIGRTPNVHITLEKNLPVAAGVGGGSADAAATLRGLIRFWDLPIAPGDLGPLARSLGADVPACLASRPVRMTGIGDRLAPFDLTAPLPMFLVNPGVPVSTPAVFKALDLPSGPRADGIAIIGNQDVRGLVGLVGQSVNDLEAPARRLAPAIGEVLSAIAGREGCLLARMSGSGATCFGLFANSQFTDFARKAIAADQPRWWVAATVCK